MAFEWVDILKGAGSILNAGSTFYTGKQQSKIAKEELAYKKERDLKSDSKIDLVESNLDSAIENVYGNRKKKRTDDTATTGSTPVDLSMSYGA